MSVLYWTCQHYKSIAFIALCAVLGGFYGYHGRTVAELQKTAQNWQERAQNAESALAAMTEEKARLMSALEAQEQATAKAQADKKIVYRTIKEEVAKNETARDWYNGPVPDSFVRMLQNGNASHD